MEEPFEITYSSDDTSYVLAVYRSHNEDENQAQYTIVVDEVSLGVLTKTSDGSWIWKSGGKEGPNHGGVMLNPDSSQRIGKTIEEYLSGE